MSTDTAPRTRREFRASATRYVSAGHLAFHLPWLGVLAGCARDDARDGAPFLHLEAGEARTTHALATQIIPPDDEASGATQLWLVYFVDRALGVSFFVDDVLLLRSGLADLDARARAIDPRADFAALSFAQQATILRQIEHTRFFAAARGLLVIGAYGSRLL